MDSCGRCEVWHSMSTTGVPLEAVGNAANVLLAFLVSGFIVPTVLICFPLIALLMQLCGARSPRLDPPHSRTALIMVLFLGLFLFSRPSPQQDRTHHGSLPRPL